MRCAYVYFADPLDSDDKSFACSNEAGMFKNCGFDGAVCAEHKCRCRQPKIDETERCIKRGED